MDNLQDHLDVPSIVDAFACSVVSMCVSGSTANVILNNTTYIQGSKTKDINHTRHEQKSLQVNPFPYRPKRLLNSVYANPSVADLCTTILATLIVMKYETRQLLKAPSAIPQNNKSFSNALVINKRLFRLRTLSGKHDSAELSKKNHIQTFLPSKVFQHTKQGNKLFIFSKCNRTKWKSTK